MSKNYVTIDSTIFDITEKYPETIELFISIGFETLKDEQLRKTFGKSIDLKTALSLKHIDSEGFMQRLSQVIEEDGKEAVKEDRNSIRVEGILPCPIKIPLIDAFNEWLDGQEKELKSSLYYDLKAASQGIDWLRECMEGEDNPDRIPDVFMSAGFDLFFDKALIGRFKDAGIFEDITDLQHFNIDFENDSIDLRDPMGQYSMIGVVPAIFLVNTEELKGKPIPRSWSDLLKPDYENSISLPMSDLDLFNAILLNIYKSYGEEGIVKLAKNLFKSMHPAEMVHSHKQAGHRPAVTIMPYFFSKMAKQRGPMKAVWPLDGAIISPIFLLSKKNKKKQLKPIVDFFASKEVGEILAYTGKFPSVHPQVDNMLSKEHSYIWLGWDFINKHDIGELIRDCMNIFKNVV